MARSLIGNHSALLLTPPGQLPASDNPNVLLKKAIENMHPIPKIGEGGDFGELGSFLLSERNRWITGQIFHIDGGRSTLRIKA